MGGRGAEQDHINELDIEGRMKLLTGSSIQNAAGENIVDAADPVAAKVIKVSLTNAQIKAIKAAPVTALAAQGANTVIDVLSVTYVLNYGGTNVFTRPGANEDIQLSYTDAAGVDAIAVGATTLITQSASSIQKFIPAAVAVGAIATLINQPLILHNAGTNEIAGNAGNDNTIDVFIHYRVISVA